MQKEGFAFVHQQQNDDCFIGVFFFMVYKTLLDIKYRILFIHNLY